MQAPSQLRVVDQADAQGRRVHVHGACAVIEACIPHTKRVMHIPICCTHPVIGTQALSFVTRPGVKGSAGGCLCLCLFLTCSKWTSEEVEQLQNAVELDGGTPETIDWVVVAKHVPGRSSKQCREKYRNDLRPGACTPRHATNAWLLALWRQTTPSGISTWHSFARCCYSARCRCTWLQRMQCVPFIHVCSRSRNLIRMPSTLCNLGGASVCACRPQQERVDGARGVHAGQVSVCHVPRPCARASIHPVCALSSVRTGFAACMPAAAGSTVA